MSRLRSTAFAIVVSVLAASGLAGNVTGNVTGNAAADPAGESARDSAAAAGARIDAFHSLLIEVMQMPDYGVRHTALTAAVPGLFDVATIARISLGRTWRELTTGQQQDFSILLTELIVATYAARFDSYNGQSFERLDTLAANEGWVVKTRLLRKTGAPVNLDYYLRGDGVFNVVADGVSDLSLRRADYTSIVRDEGYDALLGALAAAIETHQSGD